MRPQRTAPIKPVSGSARAADLIRTIDPVCAYIRGLSRPFGVSFAVGPRRCAAMGVVRQGRRECSYQADTDTTEDAAWRRSARFGGSGSHCEWHSLRGELMLELARELLHPGRLRWRSRRACESGAEVPRGRRALALAQQPRAVDGRSAPRAPGDAGCAKLECLPGLGHLDRHRIPWNQRVCPPRHVRGA
jgi:hypothetical protein